MVGDGLTATEPPAGAREESLRAIVGADYARAGGVDDTVAGVPPQMVVAPGNEQQIAAVLAWANEAGLAVAPRGGGTKLNWGNPPARLDLIVSTERLNRVVEHAWSDLTVTAEAGCTIQTLQQTLATHGQRLALDALWPEDATVGGMLATNDNGALRFRFGGLRDLVIGVTLALSDGTLASSGGKVVKNVAGYDLPKLTTGALGTLGIVTRAIFRLHPLPRSSRAFSVAAGSSAEMERFILSMRDSKLPFAALQVRCGNDAPPVADIALEGTDEGVASQATHLAALAQPMLINDAEATVWSVRERLWSFAGTEAVAKMSVLPGEIATVIEALRRTTSARSLSWNAVLYPTGLGWLRLGSEAEAIHDSLRELRAVLEAQGGSLVVLSQPAHVSRLEAWGTPGDAQALMCAIKKQFDPKGTLNPGRFVGGI